MGEAFVPLCLSLQNSFSPIYNPEVTKYYLLQRLYLVHKGKFSWGDVMRMPLWEKKFYYEELISIQEEMEKELKKNKK